MQFLKKYKWIGFIILGCLVLMIFVCFYGDYSKELKSPFYNSGTYTFYEVPITKKLAKSLRRCSSYNRTYSTSLFDQFWSNQIGREDSFLIRPGQKDTCILIHKTSAYSRFEAEEMQIEIPRELANTIGKLFLAAYHPTAQDELDIKEFSRCMMGFSMWIGPLFGDPNNFDNQFLDELEKYLPKWDINYSKKMHQKEKEAQEKEQIHCKKIATEADSLIKKTSNFTQLNAVEKSAIVKQAHAAVSPCYGIIGCGGGPDYYDDRQKEGQINSYSHVSKCHIVYNDTGVIAQNFETKNIFEEEKLPQKCW